MPRRTAGDAKSRHRGESPHVALPTIERTVSHHLNHSQRKKVAARARAALSEAAGTGLAGFAVVFVFVPGMDRAPSLGGLAGAPARILTCPMAPTCRGTSGIAAACPTGKGGREEWWGRDEVSLYFHPQQR